VWKRCILQDTDFDIDIAGEIEGLMDFEGYIGTAVEQVEAVVEQLRGRH